MKFNKSNITDILYSAIAKRFSDFSPYDFEDFIGQLFKDSGYQVEGTNYSGDYGADVIVKKHRIKTAIQVKRYAQGNKVGVQEINQIIGGKEYHNCDKAMVITTSDFSKQGRKLASETNVELWNWEDLLLQIQNTYLNGEDYYTFYKDKTSLNNVEELSFEYRRDEESGIQNRADDAILVYFNVINNTDKNLDVIITEQPILIKKNKIQVQSLAILKGHDPTGKLYAGCSAELAFFLSTERISRLSYGDRFIFTAGVDGEEKTFESTIGVSRLMNFNFLYSMLKILLFFLFLIWIFSSL